MDWSAYRIPVRRGRSQDMKYDKSEAMLSVEIPTYTVELKTHELFTLLTYIARRNPDVVNLLGTSDYPIEKILQNYFQCMYWENIGWKEKEYCLSLIHI